MVLFVRAPTTKPLPATQKPYLSYKRLPVPPQRQIYIVRNNICCIILVISEWSAEINNMEVTIMAYHITHIRTSENNATTTDKITRVKLEGGTEETVEQVVKYLDAKMEYYYTTSNNSKALVESVHPTHGQPYIRTKANHTTKDNLLNLPRF